MRVIRMVRAGRLPRLPVVDARIDLAPLGLGLAALGRPAYITTRRALDLGGDRTFVSDAGARTPHARRGMGTRHPLHRCGALVRSRRGVPRVVARCAPRAPRRAHDRVEVGIRVRRRMAHGRRGARTQGALARHARSAVARDARRARRRTRPVPDPLAHARQPGPPVPPSSTACARSPRPVSASASRRAAHARPTHSTAHATCPTRRSARYRRRGTCSSRRPRRRSHGRTTPDGSSWSRSGRERPVEPRRRGRRVGCCCARRIRWAVDRRVRDRRRPVAALVRHRALGAVTESQLASNLASRASRRPHALAGLAEDPSAALLRRAGRATRKPTA